MMKKQRWISWGLIPFLYFYIFPIHESLRSPSLSTAPPEASQSVSPSPGLPARAVARGLSMDGRQAQGFRELERCDKLPAIAVTVIGERLKVGLEFLPDSRPGTSSKKVLVRLNYSSIESSTSRLSHARCPPPVGSTSSPTTTVYGSGRLLSSPTLTISNFSPQRPRQPPLPMALGRLSRRLLPPSTLTIPNFSSPLVAHRP